MLVSLIATKILCVDEITYTKHLAPIFIGQCAPCHRAGGPAPFDFTSYDGVKANLPLIRQQLQSKAMPPVRTISGYVQQRFRSLTDDELVIFQKWDQAGALPDSGRTSMVSLDPPFTASHVIHVGSSQPVKSEGAPYWGELSLKSLANLVISSFNIRADNPRAIKSAMLLAVPTGRTVTPIEHTNIPPANAKLVGFWSPLLPSFDLPQGVGYKVPTGYELKLWILFQPQGKPVSDAMTVYLGSPEGKPKLVHESRFQYPSFEVKARESKWLSVSLPVENDTTLYAATPLARFYCNVIIFSVESPSGDTKEIARINKHDPYWTQVLRFSTPLQLTAGSKIKAKFFFANDEYCRMNEGKVPAVVKSGQKITDEACELRLLLSD